MKTTASLLQTLLVGGALALGVTVAPAVSHASGEAIPTAPAGAKTEARSIIIHLTRGSDDLHAVSMALELGTEMAKRGAKVTLFVDLEAARIADSRQPLGLRWGPSERTLAQLYDAFVAAQGAVLVCPHCAEAVGLRAGDLRRGARIGTFEQIAAAILAADQVLDY